MNAEKKSQNPVSIESDRFKIPNSTPSSSSIVPVNPIKYQYYQSADALNISVLVKGIKEEEVRDRGREKERENDRERVCQSKRERERE